MSRPRIKNRDACRYVNERRSFVSMEGTLSAYEQSTGDRHVYVVKSYGPATVVIYVYDYRAKQWYGNAPAFAETTSRHQTCARPIADIRWVDQQTMRDIAAYGAVGAVEAKLRRVA